MKTKLIEFKNNRNDILRGVYTFPENNFKPFLDKILHIHGNKDAVVPLESVSVNFSNQIIVEGGDHDLEKPDQTKQWLEKVVEFLK